MTKRGFKFFNNICYENSCPTSPINTIEKNNDGICFGKFHYYNDSNILTCFDEGIFCKTYSPSYRYSNLDSLECFSSLDICIERGLKIFNYNCYNECPENTNQKSGYSFCICSNYFHKDENNNINCFDSDKTCQSEGFLYINKETKECFNTKEECIERGYKVIKDENNDNICICSGYLLINENNSLECFESEMDCAIKGFYFNKEAKECFLSKNICIKNNRKILGKECLDSCPQNTKIIEASNICECTNYFINNNGIFNCFDKDKICENEGYLTNNDINNKECINNCNSFDFIRGICKINTKNPIDKIKMIMNVQKDILNGKLDSLLLNIINVDKNDIL